LFNWIFTSVFYLFFRRSLRLRRFFFRSFFRNLFWSFFRFSRTRRCRRIETGIQEKGLESFFIDADVLYTELFCRNFIRKEICDAEYSLLEDYLEDRLERIHDSSEH